MVRVIRRALQGLLLLLAPTPSWANLTLDVVKSTDQSSAATTIATPAFTTTSGNELLLAFVATDVKLAGITATGVTGGTLTWVLVQRANGQLGTAEIWWAFAASTLSNVTVKATLVFGTLVPARNAGERGDGGPFDSTVGV